MSNSYPPPPPKSTSPWVWVGIGCVVVILAFVAVVVGLGIFGVRKAKQLEAELKDPAKREARVKEVLGASEIPPGYHPFLAFSLPFLLDMAMLSDRAPDSPEARSGAFERTGFVFLRLKFRGSASDEQELRDYVEGKRGDVSVLHQRGIQTKQGETIGRGSFDSGGTKVSWMAHRGDVQVEQSRVEGIVTTMFIECGDHRPRIALWFAPDPAPGKKVEEIDVTGTPADEAALRKMLGYFRLCG